MSILKVCGMRDIDNIRAVLKLKPALMGFIFYPASVRYVGDLNLGNIDFGKTKKVGVFVNASLNDLASIVQKHGLDYVQLHGDETVEYAQAVHALGVKIIKVFRVHDQLPLDAINAFSTFVEMYLFDTFSEQYGGSGKQFQWDILDNFPIKTPFLVSGGVSSENVKNLHLIQNASFAGIDVNSKVEISPAIKDIGLVQKLQKLWV